MAETTIRAVIDTSDLDEAIVKAKILNEELEKAKSLRSEVACRRCENSIEGSILLTSEELKPMEMTDSEIGRIALKLLEHLRR